MSSSYRFGPDADQLSDILGGTWESKPESGWRYSGFCYYPPLFQPGDLLLASVPGWSVGLKPQDLAAADYSKAGAVLACHNAKVGLELPVLRVPHLKKAIARLADNIRNVSPARHFAVTGSVGKSTTTFLLQHALAGQGTVAKTNGGKNNLRLGVSMTLAQAAASEFCVGEISHEALPSRQARRFRPELVIFTSIAPAHSEEMGSLEEIARRKSSLLTYLNPGGAAVLNRDMPHYDLVRAVADAHAETVVTYGEHAESQVRLIGFNVTTNQATVSIQGETCEFSVGARGKHVAINAVGVLAAIHAAGLNWQQAVQQLAGAYVPDNRGQEFEFQLNGKSLRVIDDAYNANPMSMRASITQLGAEPVGQGRRRIAVLADMLELGAENAHHHRQLAQVIRDAGLDRVYTAGPLMAHLAQELPPQILGAHTSTAAELEEILRIEADDGDLLLFKASRGTGLLKIPAAWRAQSQTASAHAAAVWYQGTATMRSVQHRTTPSLCLLSGHKTLLAVDADIRHRPGELTTLMQQYVSASAEVPEQLLKAMNDAAARLGMSSTQYHSLSGTEHDADITTARDTAALGVALSHLPVAEASCPDSIDQQLRDVGCTGAFLTSAGQQWHLVFATAGGEPLVGVVLGARSQQDAIGWALSALQEAR